MQQHCQQPASACMAPVKTADTATSLVKHNSPLTSASTHLLQAGGERPCASTKSASRNATQKTGRWPSHALLMCAHECRAGLSGCSCVAPLKRRPKKSDGSTSKGQLTRKLLRQQHGKLTKQHACRAALLRALMAVAHQHTMSFAITKLNCIKMTTRMHEKWRAVM
jgi:hypothetical protein